MAAEIYGISTIYDETLASITILANTWYKVNGSQIIFDGVVYVNGDVFYSGSLTTAYSPFGATADLIAVVYGISITYDLTIWYFEEGEGTLSAPQYTDDISLPRLADYEVELNPFGNSYLIALQGLDAGDLLTYDELNTLIGSNPNMTATIDSILNLIKEIITA